MANVLSVTSVPPVTVRRYRTIGEAAHEMDIHGVGALLVMDDRDHLVGIVTDRDIVLRGVARGVPMEASIDRLMTTEVFTLPADVEIDRAYEVFRDHALRRLPVLDGGRVVGVLSIDDLLIRDARRIEDVVRPLAREVIARHRRTPVGAGGAVRAGDGAAHADNGGAYAGTGAGRGGTYADSGVIASRRLVRAHPGDTLVIHGRTLGRPERSGEILEVRSPSGDPPFLVSWSDSDHVSFTYPGPDAEVRPRAEAATAATGERAGNGQR
ncbi:MULTISPECIES: DUF1918 domain-containing protein [unclassified Frankia]|uniref:DUF1918 domain-containing protein n=1 Tax=unclassified Frankia TaxID=2632575 RepID=UPI002023E0BD